MIKVITLNWPICPSRKCTPLPGFKIHSPFINRTTLMEKMEDYFFFNLPSSNMKLKSPVLLASQLQFPGAMGPRLLSLGPVGKGTGPPLRTQLILDLYCPPWGPRATHGYWALEMQWVQIEMCYKYKTHAGFGRIQSTFMLITCGMTTFLIYALNSLTFPFSHSFTYSYYISFLWRPIIFASRISWRPSWLK